MSKSVQIASVFTAIGFKVNKKDLDKLQKQLVDLKKQLTKLQSVAKLNINPNTQGLQSARRELMGINRELAKIKTKAIRVNVNRGTTGSGVTGSRGSTARGVAGGAFAGSALSDAGQFSRGAGAVGIAAFAGAGIFQTTAKIDAIKNALGAAAGGAEEGAKQFKFLEDTSERIGINLIDNARSYQNFLAASNAVGFSTDNAQKSFTATASAARVLGLSAADTNGAMRAMTQILSKGTVQAEELRGQLGERVPGAVGMMAKAVAEMQGKTEVTVQELGKMLEQGEIISKDVMPFFSKQLLKMATAHGALEHAQKTPLANLERMRNSFVKFQDAIGRSNFVFELSLLFQQLSTGMKESTKEGTILGAALGILMNVFQAIAGILTAFPGWLKALFVIWGALMIPLLIPLLAIAAVLLLIDDFISHMQGKGGFFTDLLGEDGFFKFIDRFKSEMEGIADAFWDRWIENLTWIPRKGAKIGLAAISAIANPKQAYDKVQEFRANREATERGLTLLVPEQGPPEDTRTIFPVGGSPVEVIISTTEELSATVKKYDRGG